MRLCHVKGFALLLSLKDISYRLKNTMCFIRTILLIIMLATSICTNAQIGISDSFYKVLPPQLRPSNRSALSIQELQNIMSHASSLPYEAFQPDISSIENELSNYAASNDYSITDRIKSIKAILSFYWDLSSGDSLSKYSDRLLKLTGDDPSFKADIAYAQISKSIKFSNTEKYHEAITLIQSAEQNPQGIKTDSLLMSAFYNAYCLPYYYLNIYDKAIYYANQSLAWCPAEEKWRTGGTQAILTLALLRVYLLSKDPDRNRKQGDTALQLVNTVMKHEKANAPPVPSLKFFARSTPFLETVNPASPPPPFSPAASKYQKSSPA